MDRENRGAFAEQRHVDAYVKVTATQDDRTTGPSRARRAGADRLDRAMGARRLHLRADRDRARRSAAALAATPATLPQTIDAWGRGFWDLIPFTLQMALVIITGHVLATSPPMGRLIRAIASWPRIAARRRRAGRVLRAGERRGSTGASASSSARCWRSRSRGASRASTTARSRRRACSASAASGRRASADRRRCRWRRPARSRRRSATSSRTAAWSPGGLIPFRHTIFLWQSFVCRRRRDRGRRGA